MLVVDNGSTDNGPALVRQFMASDPRIRLLDCPKRGPGAARNFGLAQAKGEWILFLDADDLLEPTQLADQLFVASQDAGVIVGEWQEFTDGMPDQRTHKGIPRELKDSTIAFAPWAPHAALVRRSILEGPYLWLEELDPLLAEDIPFWFRLVSDFEVVSSHACGALYRAMSADCRTNLQPEKWFIGLDAAIGTNLSFLREKGCCPTPGQCEALMRMYVDIVALAAKAQSAEIQNRALENVGHWLREYFRQGGRHRLGMLLRRGLGARLFFRLFKR